uniref:SAND domain-containing protein n=1 Tax=Parastrongyloides trichosuri TaxID=131310 RepID=A0A0N4ZE36_PARTI
MKTELDDSNFGNHIDITNSFNNSNNNQRIDIKPSDLVLKDKKLLEVRCGTLYGTLHIDKFLCPGIHCKCIEHEGVLITPRHFTVQAQKDKQKDWKGSIRIGRYNLRTLMEMKVIDFFEHDIRCSLKCHSRNYIKNSRKMLSESLQEIENASKLLHHPDTLPTTSEIRHNKDEDIHMEIPFEKNSSQMILDFMTKNLQQSNEEHHIIDKHIDPKTSDSPTSSINHQSTSSVITDSSTSSEVSVMSSATQHQQPSVIQGPPMNNFLAALIEHQKQVQMIAILSANNNNNNNNNNNRPPVITNLPQNTGPYRPNFDHIKKVMESSPTEFWMQMKRLGILEDLLNVLSVSVENLKKIYLNDTSCNNEYAAIRLSKLASSLDLGELFGQRIHARYIQTTLENNLLANLQRKMAGLTGHINIGGNIFMASNNPLKRKNTDNIFGDNKILQNQCSSIFSTINSVNNTHPNIAFIESLKRQRLDNK